MDDELLDAIRRKDWNHANTLIAQMDAKDREKHARLNRPQALLRTALWYARHGLRVFPLMPGLKRPHPKTHGLTDATDDPALLTAAWGRWPGSNIGIATGHVVDVIDIDGPAGVVSWSTNVYQGEEYVGPPILGWASTPRDGGHHVYIPAREGRRNGAKLWRGVDTRALGGYVVAPPSHDQAGRRYVWLSPLDLREGT